MPLSIKHLLAWVLVEEFVVLVSALKTVAFVSPIGVKITNIINNENIFF